jgi:hypothetical protein
VVGAIYTDDLLDRIFSRFCIGRPFNHAARSASVSISSRISRSTMSHID